MKVFENTLIENKQTIALAMWQKITIFNRKELAWHFVPSAGNGIHHDEK